MWSPGDRVRVVVPGEGPGASGFTLLELLVVVALIALLAAIVPPALFSDGTREFNRAVNSAVLALKRARLDAVMERRSKALTFSSQAPERDQAGVWYRENIEVALVEADDTVSGQEVAIRFFPDGSSPGGILEFRGDRLKRRVAVQSGSGRIDRLEEN